MQSKLLSFLQSILLCGPAVGTCTTFPTWDHLIVFLKRKTLSPGPELVENLSGVQLIVRRAPAWRPPMVALGVTVFLYKSPTFWKNSHHARGKLLRRRLGRQDCEPPPLLSSPDQKAWCKVFRTQCGFFALERRSWWCPHCQGTWVDKSLYWEIHLLGNF